MASRLSRWDDDGAGVMAAVITKPDGPIGLQCGNSIDGTVESVDTGPSPLEFSPLFCRKRRV